MIIIKSKEKIESGNIERLAVSAEQRKLFSVKETANLLGISERTLWSITTPRGMLVCCRIGSRVMYSLEAIERFIAEQEGINN